MIHSNKTDFYRHLSFAAVGGFFGAYALLCRSGILANAQTMNLLELVLSALRGDLRAVLLHIGVLAVYVAGTMLTVLLPYFCRVDNHKAAVFIDAAALLLLGFLPQKMNVLLSLYPIFFAMSFQWSSFSGAQDFVSSTIFSTNNTKQTSLAFAEYLCDKDRAHFRKLRFYGCTLLAFHLGATVGYFAVKLLALRGAWLGIALTGVAYYMVLCEEAYEKAKLLDDDLPVDAVTE